MKKCIRYLDGVNSVEIEYSDENLINHIKSIIDTVPNCNQICMTFNSTPFNKGEVFVGLSNTLNTSVYKKYAAFCLHYINLEEETWSDCVPECQREKRVIQKAFPNVKVISNFR